MLLLVVVPSRRLSLQAIFKAPAAPPGDTHELIEQYWVEGGALERVDPEASGRYVVTPGVKTHLSALARAALLRRHPILLPGPTSSGKTSLVEYLAQRTGHRFMRINNHEHTDLQEYLGSYVTDENGKDITPGLKVAALACMCFPSVWRDGFLFFSSRGDTPATVRYSYARKPWAISSWKVVGEQNPSLGLCLPSKGVMSGCV